ncbi:MAG: hypothetical protein ACJATT_005636 [Myxococcota bacterium]|jgi:hypothetical protein
MRGLLVVLTLVGEHTECDEMSIPDENSGSGNSNGPGSQSGIGLGCSSIATGSATPLVGLLLPLFGLLGMRRARCLWLGALAIGVLSCSGMCSRSTGAAGPPAADG